MASFEKRGNTWRYRVCVGKDPKTGNYKYTSKSGFKRKSDAKHHAELLERQIRNDEYIPPSSYSFEAVANTWLEEYAKKFKVSTVKNRRISIAHAINFFGDKPIQSIKTRDYQLFLEHVSDQFSKNFVTNIHASTKMCLDYAYRTKLINKRPYVGAKRPKRKKTVEELRDKDIRQRFFEKDELHEFLKLAKETDVPNDFELFATMAYTGMRIGEAIALKWSDIDFENKTIHIYKTYFNPTNKRKSFDILTPKTESSIRKITVDQHILDLLWRYKRDKQDKWHDEFYFEEDYIFTNVNGYPMPMNNVDYWIKRIVNKMDIDKHISSHSFRYTHCSLLIEAGVHIKEIQERLGHSSIEITMNVYAQMTETGKRNASEKFSKLMDGISDDLIS